jgi:hypothetical protein
MNNWSNLKKGSVPVSLPEQDRELLDLIEAEIDERRSSIFAHFSKWRRNPVGFIEEALLGFLWSKQKEIALSVLNNRRTAVQSCHDVGKSYIASRVLAWWIACNDPGSAFAVSLAPTFHQVRGILWREINKAHAAGGLPGRMNQTEWWIDPELVAFGRSPADTDPTAIQGVHAARVLIVGDEACGLAKAILDAADTLIANDDSRVLLIGNPDDPSTEFERICRPGSGWNVIRIDAFESPNFTGEKVPDWLRPLLVSKTWVEEKRISWGETSPLWFSKVRGLFPEQADDALVPISAIRAAHARFEDASEEGENELGIDVARFGNDASVFYRRKGWKAWVEHRHKKRDLMQLVGHVVRLCRIDKPARIKIDDNGMGGGVTDRLREIKAYIGKDPEQTAAAAALAGVEIIPINVGEAPASNRADERFKNKRAEINWQMHEIFTSPNAKIALGPNDELDAQATQIKYKLTSTGEIQIESKADMKKRTKGVSPDDWDALCLAFAAPSYAGAGIMEYYRRQAEEAKQSEATAAAPKLPPALSTGGVRLIVPDGVSAVYGMTGRMYVVTAGEIIADPDDAAPLLGQGFRKPES